MTAASDLVRRTCAAQGLPERIEDPAILATIATILLTARSGNRAARERAS